MIKHMETENSRLSRVEAEYFKLVVKGEESWLNVDELEELRNLISAFWDNNNLWHLTKRAKEEREQCRLERGIPLGLNPVAE